MSYVGGNKMGRGLQDRKIFSGSGIPVDATGQERPRTKNDFYPTDKKTVLATLMTIGKDIPKDKIVRVLDPGCGTGIWGECVRELYPRVQYPYVHITGVEKDEQFPHHPAYDLWVQGNFLNHPDVLGWAQVIEQRHPGFDWILGNPPYELDTEFLAQSFRLVDRHHGRIDFLYRLGFAASEDRAFDFYLNGFGFTTQYIYNSRPSFLGTESRATYPGDFATFSWEFAHGAVVQAQRTQHIVCKSCAICGALVLPTFRAKAYYCADHAGLLDVPAPLDFRTYVETGYLNFLHRELRRCERLRMRVEGEGDHERAALYDAEMHALQEELTTHLHSIGGQL